MLAGFMALACFTVGALPLSGGDPEAEAQALLEKAQKLSSKGQYERAFREYQKLAEAYPGTSAGITASQRSRPNCLLGWSELVRHGPPENRVDIAVMGDGYTLEKQNSFDDLAEDVPRIFQRDSVFREYYSYLNITRANLKSEEDGLDGYGREASTAVDASVWAESAQGQVIVDFDRVQSYLRQLYNEDGLAIVVVPLGIAGTGGRGVAAVGGRDFKTMIHEFGHSFANLKDEYDNHTVPRGEIPNDINVANGEDPKTVPWAHWLEAEVPGIGVYEGADGRVRGAFRPTNNCRMATGESFCRVCREALVLRIYDFVDPIDASTPPPLDPARPLEGSEPHGFEVVAMRPETHVLECRWWVLPEELAPRPQRRDYRLRRERGALKEIEEEPVLVSRVNKKAVHRFELDPGQLEPGTYRVICRVRDTTSLRGEKWPWVLLDEYGVLESERSWKVVVP